MKFINSISVILLLIYQLSSLLFAQQNLPEDIKQQVLERIDKGYHLGTVIGIIDKNGTRYYGFGQMSLTDKSTPDERSIFEIGSITKVFTTTLLADLESQKEMNMKDPVVNYIPLFKKVIKDDKKTITLENLATHTSGLPREPLNMDPNNDHRYRDYSVKDLNEFLSGYSLDSIPNTFSYSNLGILILEHAIESKMNTTYESLIKDRITSVLSMNDTHFDVPNDKRNRLVSGFRKGQITDEVDLGQFPSMGGMRTTAEDMLKFLGAHLGIYNSSLSGVMKTTHRERFADDKNVMGLGWNILKREESGKVIHYHKGGTNGFVSFAGFDIKNQIGVVVLINGRQYFSDLGFRILDSTYPLFKPE